MPRPKKYYNLTIPSCGPLPTNSSTTNSALTLMQHLDQSKHGKTFQHTTKESILTSMIGETLDKSPDEGFGWANTQTSTQPKYGEKLHVWIGLSTRNLESTGPTMKSLRRISNKQNSPKQHPRNTSKHQHSALKDTKTTYPLDDARTLFDGTMPPLNAFPAKSKLWSMKRRTRHHHSTT